MRRVTAVLLLAVLSACGSSSTGPAPSGPTQPSPAPGRAVVATLTDTISGQSLGTVTNDVASLPARIDYIVPGYITRSAWVSTTPVVIELIPDGPPFSLGFYRNFVRGTLDPERTIQPIRRWTRAPSVFLKTVDEEGTPIAAAQLDSVEQTILQAAPFFTGNRFGVTHVERGTTTREGQTGWITVKWPTTATEAICGRASVGPDGGYIELLYRRGGNCACGTLATRPRTVRHELGHSFGFWHTDSTADLMSGEGVAGCDGMPSERERLHASIAYSRPSGNRDVDIDPQTTLSTTAANLRRLIVIDD